MQPRLITICSRGLQFIVYRPYAARMVKLSNGIISVIFVAQRTELDADGYAKAAAMMVELAAQQDGYIGIDSARGADGLGITISYWMDEASAKAWRNHPDHAAIRDAGRDLWYSEYSLHVAKVTRSYDWKKA